MKKLILAVALMILMATAAFSSVHPMKELPLTVREKVAGGIGNLLVKYAFVRGDAPKDEVIKEMGYMVLLPGDSVGVHSHDGTEDSYLISSGKGIVTDDEKEYEVTAGDMTVCRSGHKHGIRNNGDVPLVFFAVLSSVNDTSKK